MHGIKDVYRAELSGHLRQGFQNAPPWSVNVKKITVGQIVGQ